MARTRQQIAVQVSIYVLEYWVTFKKPCPYNAVTRQFGKALHHAGVEPYALPGLPEVQAYLHSWLTPNGARHFMPLAVWRGLDEAEKERLMGVKRVDVTLLRAVQTEALEAHSNENSMRALKEKLDKSA